MIFHHSRESSSDSDMEFCETSRSEKEMEKVKKHLVDLVENPIERLQGCSSVSHVTDSGSPTYVGVAKHQV